MEDEKGKIHLYYQHEEERPKVVVSPHFPSFVCIDRGVSDGAPESAIQSRWTDFFVVSCGVSSGKSEIDEIEHSGFCFSESQCEVAWLDVSVQVS